MKLRWHRKIGIAHWHAAHEVNARVTALLEIDRLDDSWNLVFAHAFFQFLRHRLDGLVCELRCEANAVDLLDTPDCPHQPDLAAQISEGSVRKLLAQSIVVLIWNGADQTDLLRLQAAFAN
jgi:hypothetical protein